MQEKQQEGTPKHPPKSHITIRTRRIGANPEKSDLVNFRGPNWKKFSELCVLLFFLGKIDKILPKPRFSKHIFGHSAGSTKLDRPYCKQFRYKCFRRTQIRWVTWRSSREILEDFLLPSLHKADATAPRPLHKITLSDLKGSWSCSYSKQGGYSVFYVSNLMKVYGLRTWRPDV